MNKFLEISHFKTRPIIYATTISIGFAMNIFILENFSESLYIVTSILLYLVILAELYVTANHYHIIHRKNTHAVYDFEAHKSVQFSHHIFLPTLFFLSLVGFIYFNNSNAINFLVVLGSFALFGVLFENIYSFYRHQYSLNKSTNYIYDLLSVILMFLATDVILNVGLNYTSGFNIELLLFAIFSFIMLFLLTIRHTIDLNILIISSISWVLFNLVHYFLFTQYDSFNLIAFILTLTFQTYTLFVNHYTEGKITREHILEYVISLMLIFSILNFYIGT